MVLLHEVAHVKRWDFLANVVSQMIAAVYWFNPLVWVALRRMRAEREQACDDLVLGLGTKASEYATELLQIASAGLAPQFRTFGGIAIAHTSKLEQRLVAILDVHRNRKPVSARITVAALVFVMLALLPIALLRGAASQPSKTQDETRYFVRLVLADGKLSFEGDEVTWKTLDDRLQRIGDRAHTVFEFAISSEDLTLAQFKQAQAQAIELSKRFGFEYFSYIGVQPPGSKGSPPTPRRELASDQKKSAVTQTVDDDLKRISEIQQLLILLKSAEDEFNRASQLIKDHIIPETAFKRAQEYVELLKAEIQRKDGSVKRLEVRKAVSQAEDDFRRASVLFKDHIISEDAYNQAKERLDLVKAEINFDPAEAETARRLRTAEVQYRQAEDDFRRASELFKERIVSQSTFEAAKQKVDTLEYELARVKASQTNLPPVQRIGAQLQVAQRGLESLRSAHKDGLVTDEDYERAKKTVELLTEEFKRSQEVLSR